jgi:hypothetical protein
MANRSDALEKLFDSLATHQPAEVAGVPAYNRVLTPAERRAEETTRAAREITDAEAEKRQADVGRLRAARLAREAEDAEAAEAAAAAAPVKKTRKKASS